MRRNKQGVTLHSEKKKPCRKWWNGNVNQGWIIQWNGLHRFHIRQVLLYIYSWYCLCCCCCVNSVPWVYPSWTVPTPPWWPLTLPRGKGYLPSHDPRHGQKNKRGPVGGKKPRSGGFITIVYMKQTVKFQHMIIIILKKSLLLHLHLCIFTLIFGGLRKSCR